MTKVGIVECVVCLVPFVDSDIVKPPLSSKLNPSFFSFGFSRKFLCSSVLLHYFILVC